jgi:hypothetical protein
MSDLNASALLVASKTTATDSLKATAHEQATEIVCDGRLCRRRRLRRCCVFIYYYYLFIRHRSLS